jgi:hypothetical protein
MIFIDRDLIRSGKKAEDGDRERANITSFNGKSSGESRTMAAVV